MTKNHLDSHTSCIQDRNCKFVHKLDVKEKRRFSQSLQKSVSSSLVYRPVKLKGSIHVGFKVVYSGKGFRDINAINISKSILTIVLIPDINFLNSYRPLSGSIARATHSEVVCCSYTDSEDDCVINSKLIDAFVDRLTYYKSKLQQINIISENAEVLNTIKKKVICAANDPSTSDSRPAVEHKLIRLIEVGREDEEKQKHGFVSRIASTIWGWLGSKSNEDEFSIGVESDRIDTVTSKNKHVTYEFEKRKHLFDKHVKLVNSSHCELVASKIMGG